MVLNVLLSKMLSNLLALRNGIAEDYVARCRTPTQEMVNKNYEPNEREEVVLELLKQGRDGNRPWGRVNPLFLREHSDLDKGQVEYALRNLRNAGWVTQLNRGGLYELVADPREV